MCVCVIEVRERLINHLIVFVMGLIRFDCRHVLMSSEVEQSRERELCFCTTWKLQLSCGKSINNKIACGHKANNNFNSMAPAKIPKSSQHVQYNMVQSVFFLLLSFSIILLWLLISPTFSACSVASQMDCLFEDRLAI